MCGSRYTAGRAEEIRYGKRDGGNLWISAESGEKSAAGRSTRHFGRIENRVECIMLTYNVPSWLCISCSTEESEKRLGNRHLSILALTVV